MRSLALCARKGMHATQAMPDYVMCGELIYAELEQWLVLHATMMRCFGQILCSLRISAMPEKNLAALSWKMEMLTLSTQQRLHICCGG